MEGYSSQMGNVACEVCDFLKHVHANSEWGGGGGGGG